MEELVPRPVEHAPPWASCQREDHLLQSPQAGGEGLTDQRKALCQLTSVRASITETSQATLAWKVGPRALLVGMWHAAVGEAAQLFPNLNHAVTP